MPRRREASPLAGDVLFGQRRMFLAKRGQSHANMRIPMRKWGNFLESFTRQHENWLVQLELFNREHSQQFVIRLRSAIMPELVDGVA